MNNIELNNLAEPLIAFGLQLGITEVDLAKREDLSRITYSNSELIRDKATSLTMQHINSLLEAYGDAITCRFKLGSLVELEIKDPGPSSVDLSNFQLRIQHSPIVDFELELDKIKLTEILFNKVPGCSVFLYLFPSSLEQFANSGLKRLESLLWGSEFTKKVIILVPKREIWLDGPFLAVLGGDHIKDWRETCTSKPSDINRTEIMQHIFKTCQDTLKWQYPWLQHLTPLHLKLNGRALPKDPIANALQAHLVNSIILYTADRTAGNNDKPLLSTYVGDAQSVELTLYEPKDLLEEGSIGIPILMEMLEWAYEPRSADRLRLLQICVIRALNAAAPGVRFKLLIHNAAKILDDLKWNWKAFIEGKVDAYMSEIRSLEDYIADTTKAFADQIGAMIKSLLDTMLAAVAALLSSFIASLFGDKFNPTVFKIGMIVYAMYVLIFPLGFNMCNINTTYKMLVNSFNIRRVHFEERLYADNVNKILGNQVKDSEDNFDWWFKATAAAYAIVFFLAIIAAFLVPELMANINLNTTQALK